MKTRSTSVMGSMHPVLFFSLIYAVALFLSILICSAVFYKLRGPGTQSQDSFSIPVTSITADPGSSMILR